MLLCISGGVLVCLEYPSKHIKLHQGLDYIVYSQYCIDFLFMSLDVKEIFL